MEALMTLDCSNYSESIADVLKIFQQIGWYIYNPQGKVEYLPIGDDDEYDWQCDEISESELYDIISKKIAGKEQGCIQFFRQLYGIPVQLLQRRLLCRLL